MSVARRLFVPPGTLTDSEVRIEGPEFHHLVNVLRVQPGDTLILLDGTGAAFTSVIDSVGKRSICTRILGAASNPPIPPIHITVAQAIGKGDRFDQALQHSTEAGASAFIPLITSRTIVKVENARTKRKRWQQIVKGAAEQSGRGEIPQVEEPTQFRTIVGRFGEFPLPIVLDASGEPLKRILSKREHVEQSPCLVLVGPEGGFSPEELRSAAESGGRTVSLGPFTYRTETAAVAALSQLMFWFAGED